MRWIAVGLSVLGVVAVAAGVWSATQVTSSAAFGWTAYAPISRTAYPVFVTPSWWALLLLAAGSAAVGAAVAVLLIDLRGRRRG